MSHSTVDAMFLFTKKKKYKSSAGHVAAANKEQKNVESVMEKSQLLTNLFL